MSDLSVEELDQMAREEAQMLQLELWMQEELEAYRYMVNHNQDHDM
jgi:hypothetical protein